MDLDDFFGKPILKVLEKFTKQYPVVDYSKVETDEFLKVAEQGFYLQAQNGNGVISSYRIYLKSYDNYYPADESIKTSYTNFQTVEKVKNKFGSDSSQIPSITIPGLNPTLPGIKYRYKDLELSFYYESNSVVYIHVEKV